MKNYLFAIVHALLLLSTVVISNSLYGQTLEVYHGAAGDDRSQFISDMPNGIKATNNYTISVRKGKKITISVINTNPVLYEYSLKRSDAKIDDGIPDLTSLLEVLTKALSLTAVTASNGSPPAFAAGSKLNLLLNQIEVVKTDLKDVANLIKASDEPESIEDAKVRNKNGGFRKAQDEISTKTSIINGDLEAELTSKLNAIFAPDGDWAGLPEGQKAILKDVFSQYIKSLLTAVNKVKKDVLDPKTAPRVISFDFEVKDAPEKFEIIAKPKSDPKGTRDTLLVTLTVVPFDGKIAELVTLASGIYATNISEYSLSNNIITERKIDDFSFKPSIMLAINLARFGEFRQSTVSVGPVFSISKNITFNSFGGAVLVSFKNILRFGVGAGVQQYPSLLKSSSNVGSTLPTGITNISDVVENKGKLALMFHIVIPGLGL